MPTINRRNVLKTMALAGSASALPMAAQAIGKNLFDNGVAGSTSLNPLPLYVDVKLVRQALSNRLRLLITVINH